MTITFPNDPFQDLAFTTIVPPPSDEDLFVPWLTRIYEDIAYTVNQKDWTSYVIAVGTTAAPIPNIANYGAFIICVAGTMDGMPAVTYSCVKSNSTIAGVPTQLSSQAGTDIGDDTTWNGVTLTIASSATNFTIVQNAATGTIGNFNVRFIGTL